MEVDSIPNISINNDAVTTNCGKCFILQTKLLTKKEVSNLGYFFLFLRYVLIFFGSYGVFVILFEYLLVWLNMHTVMDNICVSKVKTVLQHY